MPDSTPALPSFAHIAKLAVTAGDEGPLLLIATRYLDLRRRRGVLRRWRAVAYVELSEDSELGITGFVPPLSVADVNDSRVIVVAEGIARDGLPVAFAKDDKGRHRGTSLAVAGLRLSSVMGRLVDDLEVLRYYRQFLAGHPKMLPYHPKPRFRVIPVLLERIEADMEAAGKGMMRILAEG